MSKSAMPTSSSRSVSAPAINIVIEYCEMGNLGRPAALLAAALRREFPSQALEIELRPAAGGVFEVSVGSRLIFSKRATRRLPDREEIYYHVQAARDARGEGPVGVEVRATPRAALARAPVAKTAP